MPRLQGKVVVILGASADKSMGAATARRFAREGAKLILAARRVAPLEAIARETGGTAIAADISEEEDLTKLADFAVTKHGKLDVAINFAGINSFAPISDVHSPGFAGCVQRAHHWRNIFHQVHGLSYDQWRLDHYHLEPDGVGRTTRSCGLCGNKKGGGSDCPNRRR